MKTLLLLAALASQLSPTPAPAPAPDVAELAPEAPSAATAPPVAPPNDSIVIGDSVNDVMKIAANWKSLGALGIAALVLTILIRLSKMGALAKLIESRNIAWLRPVLSVLLGGAGAVVTGLQQGTRDLGGLAAAFVAGAVAGLVGIGGYELARLSSPVERARKRVDEEALDHAADALEERALRAEHEAERDVGVVRSKVAAARALPSAKRVEALAALAAPKEKPAKPKAKAKVKQ